MKPDAFRKLAALGLTTEQIAGVLEIVDAEAEEGREKARARWRKWKENKGDDADKRLQTTANVNQQLARGDVKQNNLETPNVSKKENSAPKALSDVSAFKAELTSILDDDRISALCSVRKQKKAGFSDTAGRALAKKLSQFPNINAVVDEMIVRGWVGIEPSWLNGRNLGTPTPKPKSEFRQHQEAVKRKFDEFLGIKKDDNEPAGNSPAFDLEPGNWRAH